MWVGQSVTSTGDNDFETNAITATGPIYAQGDREVYHTGNVGPGSGLDADLLDGKHADSFVSANNGVASRLQTTGYFFMTDYDDAVSAETGWETFVRDGTWHIRGRNNENHALGISLDGNAVWHQGNTRNAVGGRELADNTVEMRHMRDNSIGKTN
ncbi:hypothetical protein SY89_03534 [Halolamina pelagica]|uniref:Uncharacterized protein n=1 Tax=Halolamina pelagica TaxID=699431 RepID=A0A0P7G6V1_9EURY|nr:hypothetical protein [Halolamina pelagica]KPN28882.1 hypothetical protein SY89_03534 [Halolamina pelagica]